METPIGHVGPWSVLPPQPVADTLFRQDQGGLFRIGFQLLPQGSDVDAQILHIGLTAPDLPEDVLDRPPLSGPVAMLV